MSTKDIELPILQHFENQAPKLNSSTTVKWPSHSSLKREHLGNQQKQKVNQAHDKPRGA